MYRGGLPERLTAKHTAQPHGHSVLTSIITFSGKREGNDVVYCTSPSCPVRCYFAVFMTFQILDCLKIIRSANELGDR